MKIPPSLFSSILPFVLCGEMEFTTKGLSRDDMMVQVMIDIALAPFGNETPIPCIGPPTVFAKLQVAASNLLYRDMIIGFDVRKDTVTLVRKDGTRRTLKMGQEGTPVAKEANAALATAVVAATAAGYSGPLPEVSR